MQHSQEQVVELWLQENKRTSSELKNIFKLADTIGVTIQMVRREALDKLTGTDVHQGIAIRRRATRQSSINELDSLLLRHRNPVSLFLVLDGLQDPHNLGACLRSADAAGADAVIVPKNRAAVVNATVRKVASGAAEHMPVIAVTNIARSLVKMQQAGIWIIGMTDGAGTGIYTTDLTVPLAIVVGAEGKGLRQNTRKHCDLIVSLPMLGVVESLNVSVTAGVCLYEVLRQRQVRTDVSQ